MRYIVIILTIMWSILFGALMMHMIINHNMIVECTKLHGIPEKTPSDNIICVGINGVADLFD